jgi:alkanesulfonate monooxygenase SsuD/methylene tetrahydromethanopterin reductase-like flavin-dependent oxidoreductase (luciferase family)
MEYEHRAFGLPFLDGSTRLELLAEQVEIVHRLLTDEAVSFAGKHYRLEDARPRPAPVQEPRPPIIVGGSARSGTLRPAVRFADEYNTTFPTVEEAADRRRRLDVACAAGGRDPKTLPLSMMTGCVVGRDAAEVRDRLRRRAERSGVDEPPEEYGEKRGDSLVIGTVEEAAGRLRAYESAGVERVMLQHLDHADLDMVALIGDELVPAVA